MRPTRRLPISLFCSALCALGLPHWLEAQAPVLPYLVQPALGGLEFDQPLDIVTAPGEPSSLYVLEKTGRIIRIPDVAKPTRTVFLDLSAEIGPIIIEQGLLALAFHPDYQKNHWFYVWFTATNADDTQSFDRLSRFTVGTDGKVDPKSEQILISQIDRAANHNGGQLAFGPDGYLYLTMGDEGGANGEWGNSQLIDRSFFSCMIRIDVDKRPGSLAPNPHPAVTPGTYAIPPDNPWVGATSFNGKPVDPKKVRTEFWAVGLRNTWRWSFDSVTGLLWAGDVGQERVEAIDLIRRGGNYGWNFFESGTVFDKEPPPFSEYGFGPYMPPPLDPTRVPPPGFTFDHPLYIYYHPNLPESGAEVGQCVIGGFVYRGNALPALKERYLFADYILGWVWELSPVDGKGGKPTVQKIARQLGIVSFGQDPITGDVLVANLSSGTINRLVPNPNAAPTTAPTPTNP
jgi:glucose/arabinose dehydrogenase